MQNFTSRIANMSAKRLALLAMDLQDRLERSEYDRSEPIAIIGAACRFPGAPDLESFGRLLREGIDAVRLMPSDRWETERHYSPDPDAPGKMYTRYGSFIEGQDRFDSEFFGISARETDSMDPQQRLLLEVAWEALENAGLPASALHGTRAGVFAGISTHDYLQYGARYAHVEQMDAYQGTGCSPSVAAGRISYTLGLVGPNYPIDTACSSSLVALHLACLSLRQKDCKVALAGGVNLMLIPETFVYFCKMRALSRDGRCKTFDAAADGYGRGEGCGMVVLKRLSDAQADGDSILALIRGSDINHDGRSNGLTVPNGLAQERVITQALANARVEPHEISYIEAHGTGTPLGDPIELHALGNALRDRRDAGPFWIGSVKTNFGHLEAAAGIAGVLKVVLAMQQRELPPHLHLHQPNPYVNWANLPLRVPRERTPWQSADGRLIAGVSAFGFSGTNAHVILEATPVSAASQSPIERPIHVLCLSAKTEPALNELASRLEQELSNPAAVLPDICYSANAGRTHFDRRLLVRGKDAQQCRQALSERIKNGSSTDVRDARAGANSLAFLYSGQGSQYAGMGRALYETQPIFRRALQECDELLRAHLERPLLDLLYNEYAGLELDQTENTQPALFALEYALTRLWKSWGIAPAVVVGHSVGEYAAALAAGVFSLEDGLKLIAARGRLMQRLCRPGAMVSLDLDAEQTAAALSGYEDQVSIAAYNGPGNTVIAGESIAVEDIVQRLSGRGVRSTRLTVSHAFHSPLMHPMLEEFERVAREINYQPPQLTLISNVTGRSASREELTDPAYWVRHVRNPVRFTESARFLEKHGCGIFLEIGPKPVLIGLCQSCGIARGAPWLPSLRQSRDAWEQMLDSLQTLYLHGVEIDWRGFDEGYARRKVPLPSYPFQRKRHWLDLDMTRPVIELATDALQQASNFKHDKKTSASGADWFYEVRWEQKDSLRGQERQLEPGRWLIFANDLDAESGGEDGATTLLCDRLEKLGQQTLLVVAGDSYESASDAMWCVRAHEAEDFRRLLREIAGLDGPPVKAVIHLWSLSERNVTTADDLLLAQQRGYRSVLYLTQALVALGARNAPRLCLVTRGAQGIREHELLRGLAHSTMWGFGRVVAMEQPNLNCLMADLDPASVGAVYDRASESIRLRDQIEDLVRLFQTPDRETLLAWRDGKRYVARLSSREDLQDSQGAAKIAPDATYLITGGLGGIGLLLAEWLVKQGARRLVLTSRRAPNEQALQKIAELEATGTEVRVVRGDVGNPHDALRIIQEIRESDAPLRGLIHAAGLTDDALLLELDWSRCVNVLHPKMAGVWNLHEATREDRLDFFVCISSVSSVIGWQGVGNYAPANAFLDAMAHHRRGLGLPCISMNWGPWAGVGLAAGLKGDMLRRWDELGVYGSIDASSAVDVFGRLLATTLTQIAIMFTTWERFFQLFPIGLEPPFLEKLAQKHKRQQPPTREWTELLEAAHKAQAAARREMLTRYVEKQAAAILRLPAETRFDPARGFFELGMDSLMSVEFRNRLQVAAGTAHVFPVTVIFDRPNVGALVDYFERDVVGTIQPILQIRPIQRPPGEEPIAVIGLACRLPKGATSPEAFWQRLRAGFNAIEEVPDSRWDIDDYFDSDPQAPGKMYTRFGSFLTDIDKFDAQFFGISPREAVRMDPQQRLLLETTYHALENACQATPRLRDSRTGVYVGISVNDYVQVLSRAGDPAGIDAYLGTGNALSMAAGRISHFLGLQGPSMSVDTACSSSLVAVHLACESLRTGTSDMALAGGVNAILVPEVNVSLSKARMLAADGRCKTFDASADGYVRGEGCAVVVLKRLSDAQRSGDPILAVIRGSATNHDGRSSGLTVPNGVAQEALVRACMANAAILPDELDYVEAHGTGTPLGDPIELQALGAAMDCTRSADRPLLVGTVKTNIGHLESAAGIAGLVKVILALQHGEIPPTLHFRRPNPYIPWAELPVKVVTELLPWPRAAKRRLAGVSSFGFSGTNAHVIVEEAPSPELNDPIPSGTDRPQHILCLSAKTEASLKEVAGNVGSILGGDHAPTLADVCYTANAGRGHMPYRLAAIATTRDETADALRAFASGETGPLIKTGHCESGRPQPVFLYSGQGSQYSGMGRALFETQPVFRRAIEECDELLRPHLERRLLDLLYHESAPEAVDRTENTQPALFALEYALTQLWRSWGVTPVAVLGHSVGEYAAACAAGVFNLEDGLNLIAARGRLMQRLCRPGAMAALELDADRTAAILIGYEKRVSVAAYNGPSHTVIAGETEAIDRILEQLQSRGIKATRLKVSHAFHSPQMDPMLGEFERVAREVRFQPPQMTLISNETGLTVQAEEITDPSYWVRHVRNPVRFSQSILTAIEEGYGPFIEVGPHSTLAAMGARSAPNSKQLWLASLREKREEWAQILDCVRDLYLAGIAMDWKGFDAAYRRQWVSLPGYPFQRERFWVDTQTSKPATQQFKQGVGPKPADSHPLLGARLRSAAFKGLVYQNRFSAFSPAFLDDHRIYSMIVVPGACHLSMALSAAAEAAPDEPVVMKEISFQEPLIVPDDGERIVQLVLTPEADEIKYQVLSSSDSEEQWTLHAGGRMVAPASRVRSEAQTHVSGNAAKSLAAPVEIPNVEEIKRRCTEEISSHRLFYRIMSRQGIQLGDGFQWVERLWRRDGEALGALRTPRNPDEAAPYVIHPGLLDSCFQLMGGALSTKSLEASAYIPVSIERLRVFKRPRGALLNHVRLRPQDTRKDSYTADLLVFDESGSVVIDIGGLRIRQAPRSALMAFAQRRLRDSFYRFQWIEQAAPPLAGLSRDQAWLVFAGEGRMGEALAQVLEQRGARVVLVSAGDHYASEGAARFRINPAAPEMFDRVYREARATPDSDWTGVVFLWSAANDASELSSPDAATIEQAQEVGCRAALNLVQTMGRLRAKIPPRFYLVTRNTQAVETGVAQAPLSLAHAPIWGLARVIALEQPELRPVRIDLESAVSDDDNVRQLVHELINDGREDQIAFRNGNRWVLRLNRLAAARRQQVLTGLTGEPYQLIRSERGVLDELDLRPAPRLDPGPGEIEVLVEATGLNFRDVLNAMALYPGDAGPLGGECAGTVVAVGEGVSDFQLGDHVIAIGTGTFNLYTLVDARMAVRIPAGMKSAVAATIPVAFVTAFYGLVDIARMRTGEKVLIHAAAGGVGLAAVKLAQLSGLEIYATAGSEAKREHLRSLGVEHIYSSRALDFAAAILAATDGRGVDIVLNSLAGDFIAKSVSCLASGGRFVELGKNQIWSVERMAQERPDVSYAAMQLDNLIVNRPSFVGEMLREIMTLVSNGVLKPLPLTEFPITEAPQAFRFMAQAKHIGKIIVTHPFSDAAGSVNDRLLFRADRTYLITGGLGGLGLKLARWLADQGARHLTLVSRRSGEQAETELANLQAAGVQVMVRQADVTVREPLEKLLQEIRATSAPLGGVFHAAGVLSDGILMLQDWARFRRALDPKMLGVIYLDELTRPDPIEHFVLFSSVASVLGFPSQGNYAAGNAFLDAIAHARRQRNLPALSINWGPWSEAGMAAQASVEVQRQWASMGLGSIAPRTGMTMLDVLMRDSTSAQVAVLPVDWSRLLQRFPTGMEPTLLEGIVGDRRRGAEPSADWLALVEKVKAALPGERKRMLIEHISDQAARVLGLKDAHSIDPRAPLTELGLDSLMAVEMANQLAAQTGGAFPVTLLFDYSSIDKLAEFLLNKVLELGPPAGKNEPEAEERNTSAEITGAVIDSISELSEEEVNRRLNLEARKATNTR